VAKSGVLRPGKKLALAFFALLAVLILTGGATAIRPVNDF
jgi:hypothetical protein